MWVAVKSNGVLFQEIRTFWFQALIWKLGFARLTNAHIHPSYFSLMGTAEEGWCWVPVEAHVVSASQEDYETVATWLKKQLGSLAVIVWLVSLFSIKPWALGLE